MAGGGVDLLLGHNSVGLARGDGLADGVGDVAEDAVGGVHGAGNGARVVVEVSCLVHDGLDKLLLGGSELAEGGADARSISAVQLSKTLSG